MPRAGGHGRLPPPFVRNACLSTVLMLLLVAIVATALALQLRRRSGRRRRAMTQVLDAADALVANAHALVDSITNRKKFRSGLSIHDISRPAEMKEIAGVNE